MNYPYVVDITRGDRITMRATRTVAELQAWYKKRYIELTRREEPIKAHDLLEMSVVGAMIADEAAEEEIACDLDNLHALRTSQKE